MPVTSPPLEAVAFSAANSCAYLAAVFEAYRAGHVVLVQPKSAPDIVPPGIDVIARKEFEDAPGWFDGRLEPIFADRPAQVAFSSGTTGTPKALLLSHRALSDVVARINTAMGVDETIREYVGVPVTFSFGFGRCRAVAAAGGQSFLPANGFDPTEIAQMLRAGEINAISAVPTLWRVVLANPDVIGDAGQAVRWIEIGSQYMAAEEKQGLKGLFPNARIVQHYGLTEASRSTLLDISATQGPQLESVGRAEGAVELAIASDGSIRVRGPHLAMGLLTDEGLIPVAEEDGWLTTSDRGRLEDGWLYYEGRMDELINSGGIKIDPNRFEQKLVETLGAPDGVAVGRISDPMRGDKVLVVMTPELEAEAVKTKALRIAADYGLTGNGALSFRTVAKIPRTATGKVQRIGLNDLPVIEVCSETTASAPAEPESARAAELQALWAEVLGVSSVSIYESFYDLGGDSLSALTLILRMEAYGIDYETARGIFDGKTIADLVGLAPQKETHTEAKSEPVSDLSFSGAMNAVHATRGVLVIWVVIIHWLPGVLERIHPSLIWIYESLTPLLRFGTPGFAIVFGLGIGALRLPQFISSPARYHKSARFNTILVVSGVLILAVFKLGLLWSAGNLGHPNWPSSLFYSAISYYMLALLCMPVILGLISRGRNTLLTILGLAIVSLFIHEVLSATIASARPDGVLELIKILLTAKYGFFKMTVYVLMGAAIGHVLRNQYMRQHLMRDLLGVGAVFVALGFLLIYENNPEDMLGGFGQVLPWHLMIYVGFVLWLLAGFCQMNRGNEERGRLGHVFNATAIASGILALPIFVGHEIVIPAKNLMANLGVPEIIALAIPVLIFLGGFAIAYRRLLAFLLR